MPRGDGTGPIGRGAGSGMGNGGGGGRNNGPLAAGPGGVCICPQCGTTVPHTIGTSCMELKCPQCNSQMKRG